MAQQPRKFVEKMALLREKERQQSMAVEQVLREVRGVKSPYPRSTPEYYHPQQRMLYEAYPSYASDLSHQVALQQQRGLSQSMPVLCSPPQQQAAQLDLQRVLQERREMQMAALPLNQRQRWPLRKAMSTECRPEEPPSIISASQQTYLELPEQQCRRIKSEPDIHQSVKTSEDTMLRRRLTAAAPIPEDERTQVSEPVYQRAQYVNQNYPTGNGYTLNAGVRASSVPDLSDVPVQPNPLDQDADQGYGNLSHHQAHLGHIPRRRQGVITSPGLALRKKSPAVPSHRSHPYYGNLGEIENHIVASMPPPPLYGPDQQHQNNFSSEYMSQQQQQQPQEIVFQQRSSLDHLNPAQVYYCDASEMQQTAVLQQKFNAMNVATSADSYHQQVIADAQNHQVPGGFPGNQVIVNAHTHHGGRSSNNSDQLQQMQSPSGSNVLSSGYNSPSYGLGYNTQYSQVYSGGIMPTLPVGDVSCDMRQDSIPTMGQDIGSVQVNTQYTQLPMTTSEGLVDALFAEPLDAGELKTLLNYGDSGLLPDPETEEALKRQP
ncbi:uncharacterized protein LOC134191756 isoform X2 [Corticium candelabrum]|uniref:uncharacterized protein LOC134191756 isoform X2 n=1 Tax=Corticium candelabrum TaxID=121492 RepID=UPI002E26AA43|nr:uncharacterized protein LOC134191756 isoform X2 [Corticium candelabrum]